MSRFATTGKLAIHCSTAGAVHAASDTCDTEHARTRPSEDDPGRGGHGTEARRAAERLGLTVRQVERLVARYRESGAAGLASRKRDTPGNRRLDEGLALRARTIIRERYADFGPTLACEKLRECHGLVLSKETVRHLMTQAGLWVPRGQRPPRIYQPRARRACFGELVQIDGCEHAWFEDRAPACTLLVYVDDATSRLMTLHFTATESTFSYVSAREPPLLRA
jgi:hypothetical protein